MDEKISVNQALRILADRIGEIRVPIREREISAELESVAAGLMEVVKAIETAAGAKDRAPAAEPENEGGEQADV